MYSSSATEQQTPRTPKKTKMRMMGTMGNRHTDTQTHTAEQSRAEYSKCTANVQLTGKITAAEYSKRTAGSSAATRRRPRFSVATSHGKALQERLSAAVIGPPTPRA